MSQSPPRGSGILRRTPLSTAGCPQAPSLTRCNTCNTTCFSSAAQGHPPQTQCHSGGNRRGWESLPKPPRILPCPRAQGASAAPGTECPATSQGSPGGHGGRRWHSRRPGTGTRPRSGQSQWSARSASQWAEVTAERGKQHICNVATPQPAPTMGPGDASALPSPLSRLMSLQAAGAIPSPAGSPQLLGSPRSPWPALLHPQSTHQPQSSLLADIQEMGTHHPTLLLPNTQRNGQEKGGMGTLLCFLSGAQRELCMEIPTSRREPQTLK